MRNPSFWTWALRLTGTTAVVAAGSITRGDEPIAVPLTRPELKQMLEDSKRFVPRIQALPGADEQSRAPAAGYGPSCRKNCEMQGASP